MIAIHWKRAMAGIVLATFVFTAVACGVRATNKEFFGRTTPPERNILRYVNGGEPESLDPAISSGQPEVRIYMALYEGLVEYDPKSLNAIPAIAERWDVNTTPRSLSFTSVRMPVGLMATLSTLTISFIVLGELFHRKRCLARQALPTISSTLRRSIPDQFSCATLKVVSSS